MQTKTMTKTALKQKTGYLGNFFMEVANTKPYFKAAFEGFAGTGKTYTSAMVAIGLHKKIKSKKPVVMFDTEKSAKFLKSVFREAGIELLVKESRTLADLKETMRLLREEQVSDILLIDSISHVWEDTVEAFKRKMKRNYLQFQDWGILKPMWKSEFSDPLVRDPYNIIMCGRAGYEYENEINSETGKREIYKSGIKMKVEGETAYEPDILVLMERFEEIIGRDKKVYRQATIVKDRSTLIDGKTFINPIFKNFEPAIDEMLANPDEKESKETDSTGLFKTEDFNIEIENLTTELKNIETEFNESLKSLKSSDGERQKVIEKINKIILNLEDKKIISKKKDVIKKYFKDKEVMGTMDYVAGTINTTPLSVLCGQATDDLVTEDFRNNFTKELKELEKEHLPVEIPKGSVRKGKNKTRKQIKGHELKAILSEGEQKAVALALFLAEISKDTSFSPLILDDPVNSLDHQVIDVLAKKLIQISSERQTIIFTHNKLFYDSLVYWTSNLKNEQDQKTHHLCKNYNGGCNTNSLHVYSFKIERRSLSETGKIISKSQENSKFYLEKIEKDLQGDYTVSSVASDLKSAIEYYIDEKILYNQRLIKDYGKRQCIKWDQLKKLNPDEAIIDKLKEYWDLLSSRGSHLSANSMEDPITFEKFTEIIEFLKK